jgi:hypothetical protein
LVVYPDRSHALMLMDDLCACPHRKAGADQLTPLIENRGRHRKSRRIGEKEEGARGKFAPREMSVFLDVPVDGVRPSLGTFTANFIYLPVVLNNERFALISESRGFWINRACLPCSLTKLMQ